MRSSLGVLRRCALFVILIAAATASAASAHGRHVVGRLYVNDNTAPVNTISGFYRHADGSLTPIPGSPFSTGGAGTGAVIGSQGALQQSGNGRYLLAVDPGSNQVSVLRVRHDGALSLIHNGVVGSRGSEPVSIAVHNQLVYVANAGDAASNYTGFSMQPGGHLNPIAGSTVALPSGSQPGDVLFNGDGGDLVGTRVGTSLIDSFTVGHDGLLHAAPGAPFAAQGLGPFGSEFRPTDPTQLFVSNAHGGTDAGTVSAFHVAGDGTLTSIGASPFADHQTAPCWVEITHNGKFLFTVNTASVSVSSYAISGSGALNLLGSTPLRGPSTLGPEDARLNPDGSTLWVLDSGGRALSAFAVHGGKLTELPASPTSLPANTAPFGIVLN